MSDPMLQGVDPVQPAADVCVCGHDIIWDVDSDSWQHCNLGAAICCKTGPKPAETIRDAQAGAQVPSQDEKEIYKTVKQINANGIRATALYIMKLESKSATIKSYATEAAKTPITRESILASQKAEGLTQDDIPSDLKSQYAFATEDDADDRVPSFTDTFVAYLIERVARGQLDLRAQTQTALSQYDEMQGLCRLILAESGGSK